VLTVALKKNKIMTIEQENFLEDYNTLLSEFNEEIEGIDDMTKYTYVTKFNQIDIRNIEDYDTQELYLELKTK